MYRSHLTDTIRLQKQALATDSGGGQTTTWTHVARFACRLEAGQQTGNEMEERRGSARTWVVWMDDVIPRLEGHDRLHQLLDDLTLEVLRFVYRHTRTLTVDHYELVNAGVHDAYGASIKVHCTETPEPVGILDEAT